MPWGSRDQGLLDKVNHKLKMADTATAQFMEFVDAGRDLLANESDDTLVMFGACRSIYPDDHSVDKTGSSRDVGEAAATRGLAVTD